MKLIDEIQQLINECSDDITAMKNIFHYVVSNNISYNKLITGVEFRLDNLTTSQLNDIKTLLQREPSINLNNLFEINFE
jgi:hypothetical protein